MSLRVLVMSGAAAACVSPQSRSLYPTDQAGYNAATAPMVAQAGARPHPADAAMGQMAPIETAPASEAPPPPSPASWYCFETRQTRTRPGSTRGDTVHRSLCKTTKADCRAASDGLAGVEVRGRDRVETTVSACIEQRTAACTYRWSSGPTGQEECAASMDDCQSSLLAYTMPGGATRQSACRLAR